MNQKQKKLVEKVILNARDLMNSGGKHWIKGDECQAIPIYDKDGNEVAVEYAYCSIGAIHEASEKLGVTYEIQREAKRVLALTIDPNLVTDVTDEDYYDDWDDIIVSFNDKNETVWGQVSRRFRAAARKVYA